MKLVAQAPTRIDLAGATLDIHPLYLFQGGGLTINAAIDLTTEAVLQERDDEAIVLHSLDLESTVEADSLQELERLASDNALPLLVNIVRFYRPKGGFSLTTRSNVPAGSGLGGSSSLLIAVSSLLVQRHNLPMSKRQIIDCGADIEAMTIGIPTGKQDYYPAAFGDISALHFSIGQERREALTLSAAFRRRLAQSLLLGYSGASRFSGANNWDVVKRSIGRRQQMRPLLKRIAETAHELRQALVDEDLPRMGRCLRQEWDHRRQLAQGVSTPRVEMIFERAKEAGAWAGKICGAGGGGCFIVLAPPDRRDQVAAALEEAGGRLMDFQIDRSGVKVWEEES
ncbi:MAG TPA: galactokinase [Acidobacteriota bacterium]|nr:galactokinase [Acidobacteriota bacterium]